MPSVGRNLALIPKLLLGVFFSFIFSGGLIYACEMLSSKLSSLKQLASMDSPVLGPIETQAAPSSSFRFSRSSLNYFQEQFLGLGKKISAKSFCFAGDTSDSKIPLLVSEFAASLARAGKTVLLIDLAMTERALSALLNAKGKKGITDWLQSSRTQYPTPISVCPGVQILPTGEATVADHVVLTSEAIRDLIDKVGIPFDFILALGSPILSECEAPVASLACDQTILISFQRKTKLSGLELSLERLYGLGVKQIALVLIKPALPSRLSSLVRTAKIVFKRKEWSRDNFGIDLPSGA